LSLLNKFIIN